MQQVLSGRETTQGTAVDPDTTGIRMPATPTTATLTRATRTVAKLISTATAPLLATTRAIKPVTTPALTTAGTRVAVEEEPMQVARPRHTRMSAVTVAQVVAHTASRAVTVDAVEAQQPTDQTARCQDGQVLPSARVDQAGGDQVLTVVLPSSTMDRRRDP